MTNYNKMHADEVDITEPKVQQLRLGDKMSVRLPRAVDSIETEFFWLPKLASKLSFSSPKENLPA